MIYLEVGSTLDTIILKSQEKWNDIRFYETKINIIFDNVLSLWWLQISPTEKYFDRVKKQ